MSNILCIDIGGTRIKAAILSDNIDLQTLKDTDITVIMSLGWLNSSLPEILSKMHPYSLVNKYDNLNSYESISIGAPVKILNSGTEIDGYYVKKRGLPKNLKKSFEDLVNCEVFILNDAVCWLSGAINYYRLFSVNIDFPCLFISLGTGVGIALAQQMYNIEGLELSCINNHFSHLSIVSNQIIDKGWKIHGCLGEKYFSWIKNEQKKWPYLKIREDYTNRVLSFLLDINQKNLLSFKNIKTIFIGGGNAEYLNDRGLINKLDKKIYLLSSFNIQLNPDIIPLLGQIKLNPT